MNKSVARKKRHLRSRAKMFGVPERPRMSVYRSLNNIYVQLVDDLNGHTLVSASTIDPALKDSFKNGGNIEAAKQVGELIAERALEKDIKTVVFDRGGNKYHGRIKALAEAARKKGLQF